MLQGVLCPECALVSAANTLKPLRPKAALLGAPFPFLFTKWCKIAKVLIYNILYFLSVFFTN